MSKPNATRIHCCLRDTNMSSFCRTNEFDTQDIKVLYKSNVGLILSLAIHCNQALWWWLQSLAQLESKKFPFPVITISAIFLNDLTGFAIHGKHYF
jgi:hypothetical protein